MKTFILAQGEETRWNTPEDGYELPPCKHKHMLKIGGIPNVFRTASMVPNSIIVARNTMFTDCGFQVPRNLITLDPPGINILDAISKLGDLFDDDTVILLGDVIFSRKGLDTIYAPRDGKPMTFFGRVGENKVLNRPSYGEIFAIRVRDRLKLIEDCVYLVNSHPKINLKLWNLEHQSHRLPYSKNYDFVDFLDDWTDDVDCPSDYYLYFPIQKQLVLEDNGRLA